MKHKKSHQSRKFYFAKKMTTGMREWYESVILWHADGKLDSRVLSSATSRNHKHFVNHAALPSFKRPINKKRLTPAEYRRNSKSASAAKKRLHLLNIQKQRNERMMNRLGLSYDDLPTGV